MKNLLNVGPNCIQLSTSVQDQHDLFPRKFAVGMLGYDLAYRGVTLYHLLRQQFGGVGCLLVSLLY